MEEIADRVREIDVLISTLFVTKTEICFVDEFTVTP